MQFKKPSIIQIKIKMNIRLFKIILILSLLNSICGACWSKKSQIIVQVSKISDSIFVDNRIFNRKVYSFESGLKLDGFWNKDGDSLFYIPTSRIILKTPIKPYLFAILLADTVYTPSCLLGYNPSIIGLQYPTYISCKKSSQDGFYIVTHDLHDYADYVSDSIVELWINRRQFEIDTGGVILSSEILLKDSAALFCYD